MTRVILDYEVGDERQITVKGDELRYLKSVRRHKPGDRVEVRDSAGRRFEATVASVGRGSATLDLDEELPGVVSVWPMDIVVAPPKGNLMDDVVRKLSELGARSLIPALCERSVVRPGDAKLERWKRIARESRRQCGRDVELGVEGSTSLIQALNLTKNTSLKMILHPRGKPFPFNEDGGPRPDSISVAVGPEGGFTDDEVERAAASGFEPVGLGSSIMRIETAAIAAAVLGVALLGGFGSRR